MNDTMNHIKSTVKDTLTTIKTYIKSHLILGLIIQAILIVGLSIINYAVVDFGNFVGIYFISLGIVIIDILPVFGMLLPMAIWAVLAMTFCDNIKLGVSVLILCFITMLIKQLIEPLIVGKVMGISPIEEIISSTAGYFIFGANAVGFLLGPVIYTVIKVIYLKSIDKSFIANNPTNQDVNLKQ